MIGKWVPLGDGSDVREDVGLPSQFATQFDVGEDGVEGQPRHGEHQHDHDQHLDDLHLIMNNKDAIFVGWKLSHVVFCSVS